jgi:hypothetical protein
MNEIRLPAIKTGNNQFCSGLWILAVSTARPGLLAIQVASRGFDQLIVSLQKNVAAKRSGKIVPASCPNFLVFSEPRLASNAAPIIKEAAPPELNNAVFERSQPEIEIAVSAPAIKKTPYPIMIHELRFMLLSTKNLPESCRKSA